MTQEDKNLLLQDLCARLPYKIRCSYYDICLSAHCNGEIYGIENKEYAIVDGRCVAIEFIKPYLFPLSSMSEEQKVEYDKMCELDIEYTITQIKNNSTIWTTGLNRFNWFLKNHFDVYGLIPMGLAIDCTNLNIY